MLKISRKKAKENTRILYVTNSLNLGGAERILFDIVKKCNKKDLIIISLTLKGFYGTELIKKGYKV